MVKELSEELIKYYIEHYGDGDIYFSHYLNDNGTIDIKYLPSFTKFADEENLPEFKKELEEHPHIKDRYLKIITISDRFAYIPNDEYSNKRALVKNYSKFLEDLKEAQRQKQEKYEKKNEHCKPENNKHHNGKHTHKGGRGR